jgi:hypothetical protein
VDASNVGDADHSVELVHHARIALGPAEIVARREEMASVETYTEPLGFADPIEYLDKVFKAVADGRALTGGRFEEDATTKARAGSMHLVKRLGDPADAGLERRFLVRPGMKNEPIEAQPLAPLEFIDHRRYAHATRSRYGRGQIQQVARVGHNRLKTSLASSASNALHLLVRQRRGLPLALVLNEYLQAFAPGGFTDEKAVLEPSGHRGVGSEDWVDPASVRTYLFKFARFQSRTFAQEDTKSGEVGQGQKRGSEKMFTRCLTEGMNVLPYAAQPYRTLHAYQGCYAISSLTIEEADASLSKSAALSLGR